MSAHKNKRAVIFDLGGVVFSPPQEAIAEYERELGLPRGAIAIGFVSGAPDNAFCRLERGELTLSQFFPEFERELKLLRGDSHPLQFSTKELFGRIYSKGRLVPEIIQALKCVREEGLKTCALTNNWIDDAFESAPEKTNQLYSSYFDVVLESCKLGIRKPNPEIYRIACKRLEVEPHEAVFLDDLGQNLKPARAMGITTILVRDPGAAVRELEQVLGFSCHCEEHLHYDDGAREQHPKSTL